VQPAMEELDVDRAVARLAANRVNRQAHVNAGRAARGCNATGLRVFRCISGDGLSPLAHAYAHADAGPVIDTRGAAAAAAHRAFPPVLAINRAHVTLIEVAPLSSESIVHESPVGQPLVVEVACACV
jgi:hypothetical protein